MKLSTRLARILHFATPRNRAPIGVLPRVRDIDGPTIRLPRVGQPGVNTGRVYTSKVGQFRSPDVNQVPSRLTRQHVA